MTVVAVVLAVVLAAAVAAVVVAPLAVLPPPIPHNPRSLRPGSPIATRPSFCSCRSNVGNSCKGDERQGWKRGKWWWGEKKGRGRGKREKKAGKRGREGERREREKIKTSIPYKNEGGGRATVEDRGGKTDGWKKGNDLLRKRKSDETFPHIPTESGERMMFTYYTTDARTNG